VKQRAQRSAGSTTRPAADYLVAVAGTAATPLLRWLLGVTVGEIPPFITAYPVTTLSAAVAGDFNV
jgi:hypothetical protein